MFWKRKKIKYAAVNKAGDDDIDLDHPRKSVFTPSCVRSSLLTAVLLCTYFAPSIVLTFYQRWLFQKFRFPLCTVLIHLTVKFLLSLLWRTIKSCSKGKPSLSVAFEDNIKSIAPTGVFSGIDIGFANWGLELITVSLYTMTKSTTVIFILGFAILFKLEKKTWSLCFIVVMISLGLLLFTYKSTQFNVAGFVLLLIASMCSGLRWTCVQLLLQKSKIGMRDPVDMIYFMQPWMFASIIPFAMWIEGPRIMEQMHVFSSQNLESYFTLFAKVLVGAFIAFFMEVAEVLVVTYTSSLTLSIAGIGKEILILVLAVLWNGDRMSIVNATGLFVCLTGIVAHVVHKIGNAQQAAAGADGFPTRVYEKDTSTGDERDEMSSKSLMEKAPASFLVSDSEAEGDQNDSMDLFNILNRHDR
ncbi:solute carrier family 35 [Holotrichia oblita]|uniref:Solute carrier family 35 n=1 Tax=Holotrichia oblita TaxID=644536 RepID=A0ACB9TYH2_HOLOL|nr:solute carrier family 35 [Holotrichia oblita]